MHIIATIYDSQAKAYNPFFSQNADTAIRSFRDAMEKPGTIIHDNPEDFILYQTGIFDDLSGDVLPTEPRITLANGNQIAATLHAVGE